VLGHLVEKFLSPDINLSPNPVMKGDGTVKFPALTNHGMGFVFEELIRKFNEENNEEAGEHFTPREIVRLMASLIFLPIKDQVTSGTYTVYDCACGTGGMLTESDAMLRELGKEHKKEVSIHLYGQEVNAETYAICKADLLIQGEEERNIAFGSTLSQDAFPRNQFNFALANPPYGKSWKTDLDRLCGGDKGEMKDYRFVVTHDGDSEFSLITRSNDGQLMFLVNMLAKMKADTPLGSRVATVHNGSALFTGDAGQGESNIRQWILENDWLEAIIGLPENLFYNTGIATYIWVLTNRKPKHRRGKVQLIDATQWFTKLRKNLGQKNCEFSPAQIEQIVRTLLDFKENEQSKIFDNADFGYWQITVERPLRLCVDLSGDAITRLRVACEEAKEEPFANVVERVAGKLKGGQHSDFNKVWAAVVADADEHDAKITGKREKLFRETVCQRDEKAEPIIKKQHKDGRIEHEPDPELRDSENIPLKDNIEAYFKREVLPHVPDAWIDHDKTVKGYEISFTKYFYKHQPLRSLDDIATDLKKLERETEGLLQKITG
jgi:type I restriction enzyme M protein